MNPYVSAILKLAFWGFFLLQTSVVSSQSACDNVDFEFGNLTNWTGSIGNCCPINTPTNGIVPQRHTILTGAGSDPIVPQIPVVSPYGGTYSVRLGNSSIGAQSERLRYTFNVTAANPNFTYQYAVILQDPNHSPAQQPRFQVNVMDSAGNTIDCGFYNVVASNNIPGFQRTGSIVWKNWSFVAVDLAAYIGQEVTVEFSTGDCSLGGHYGYAYIDASCLPLRIFTNYCPGDPIANLTAPPGFQFYQWSTGQTSQAITITNPVPGDSVTVICSPFQGVSCTTVLKYIFLKNPPVEANYSTNTSCGNNQVVFSDSSTISVSGAFVTGWKWIVNDSIISTQSTATYSFPSAGTYTVTLIAESSYGCPDTLHKQVVIPQGLLVAANITSGAAGFALSCPNDNKGSLKATASLGVAPYSFQWNTVPVSTSDSVFNLSAGTYTVSVTDSTGCVATASATISAPPPVNMTPSIRNVTCFGGNNGSVNTNINGGLPPYSYSWNTVPPQTLPSLAGLVAGTYQVTITDSNQCTTAASVIVQEPTELNVAITSFTNNLCFGDANGTANASASGGSPPYTFIWNTGPPQTTINATGLRAGNYIVTVTDDSLCTATASVTINEPLMLTLTSSVTNVLCHDSAQGSISLTPADGTPPYSYIWQPSSGNNAHVQNLASGNYTVTVTDQNGCSVSGSYVISQPPPISISAEVMNELCLGNNDGSVTISVSGGLSPFAYSLHQNGNVIASGSSATITGIGSGSYTVVLTDRNNCGTSIPVSVGSPPPILIQSISADSVNCYGYNDGAIKVVAAGGVPPFLYSLGDTSNGSGVFQTLGPGTYSITVTDSGGCSTTTTAIVNEPPPHILSVVPDSVEMLLGESRAVQLISNFAPNVTYQWNPESGTDCNTCSNANLSTYTSTEYNIRAIARPHKKDCEAEVKLPVRVITNYDIFIPNVFSPNDDGANDYFEYFGNKAGVKFLTVEVFNRIGEKVFESNDINFRWNGKYKGIPQLPGVYVYLFKVTFVDNHTEKLYKGSVTLMR